ncbi:hypothetical protein AB0H83_29215 [Dactylosporangium sp. NPDC050688]|uniref:hypothetical protein n=1 Tax=Dactylosporangium sp. NPDC050688 TaxID=3157217 RepID=UPI0033CC2C17
MTEALSSPAADTPPEDTGRPGPRRPLVMVVAVVALLVAAGGAVAWWALDPDPRDAAKDYFARLADGDAAGALLAVDRRTIGAELSAGSPLLTDAALSDSASRPQAMTITRVVERGDAATMTVRYEANGAAITQTLTAHRRGRAFELENPFVRLSFAHPPAVNATRVTVNGVVLPVASTGAAVAAFPGAYAVAVDSNALFAGRAATAVPGAGGAAAVTLPPPSLSAEGRTNADAAIAAALEQCATKIFQRQPTCPEIKLFDPSEPTSMTPLSAIPLPADARVGTIVVGGSVNIAAQVTRQPACAYTPAADAADHVTFTGTGGVIHWSMQIALPGGTPVPGRSGDTPITPTGKVTIGTDGQLQVTFA